MPTTPRAEDSKNELTQVDAVIELIRVYEGDELKALLQKWIEDSSAARWVPTSALKPWADNPRNNDGRPVEAVAESISRFGFASPLLARLANGEIIAGHTRLKAAKLLGLKKVPVRYLDITEEEAHLLALADNKIGELADWKNDILAGILAELDADDLAVAGFDDDDLANILGDDDPLGPDDVEPEAPPEEPDSKLGEVYELGPHRLSCGDSTDAAAFADLLGKEKVNAVWTDPPYGVALVGGSRADASRDGKTIDGDDLDADSLEKMLTDVFLATVDCSMPGSPVYVASPGGQICAAFWRALGPRGLSLIRHELIWVKSSPVHNMNLDYPYAHEPILYGWTSGAHRPLKGSGRSTVFYHDRPFRNKEHPSMKPVSLIEEMLGRSCRTGELVLDPFGGSGSTLLAAARLGLVARLVELDPGYCDVIRKRWTAWAKGAGQDPGPGALE